MPRCIICDISNEAPSLSTTRDAVPPIRYSDYRGGFVCNACCDEDEEPQGNDPWGIDEAWEGEDYQRQEVDEY